MTPVVIAWLDAAKDLVVTAAAAAGAIVAIIGLSTWRRQLRGSADHELARRILVSVYKWRDAISVVRDPFMWASESPVPPDDEKTQMSVDQIRYYGTSKAYQKRWQGISDLKSELYAGLLESEALWGDELKNLVKAVTSLETELYLELQDYLEEMNPDETEGRKQLTRALRKQRRELLFRTLDSSDAFSKNLVASIRQIDKYLKQKLARS